MLGLLTACWAIAARYDIDLVVLHNAARLSHGQLDLIYAYNGSLGRYFYGPFSLFLIYPLGALPYGVVKWLWIVLQTVAVALVWLGLKRIYPFLGERSRHWPWLVVFAFSINPIHNNFQSNNIQLMLMVALVGAELGVRSPGRVGPFVAGLLVVGAAAVKVFPAYVAVLYWLLHGKWARWGLVAGTALSVLAPLALFGPEATASLFADFFRNLTTYSAENSLTRVPDILCLPSLVARLLGDGPLTEWTNRLLVGGISASFFFLAWRDAKRGAPAERLTQWWALGLLLMTLLNPSTRPHYFIFYVPALCLAIEATALRARRPVALAVTIVSFALIALTAEGVVGRTWNNRLEAWSVPTYGMVGLFLVLAYVLLTSRSNRAEDPSLAPGTALGTA